MIPFLYIYIAHKYRYETLQKKEHKKQKIKKTNQKKQEKPSTLDDVERILKQLQEKNMENMRKGLDNSGEGILVN